jgi:FkbM family methyltransferase
MDGHVMCGSPLHEILTLLIEREVMWLRKSIQSNKGRKIAIFAAGAYARKFCHWLEKDYDVEAHCFIDNNPELDGQTACEKAIMLRPWETDADFADRYFVLVSTKDSFYFQIAKQLDEVGVPYMSSDAFQAASLWERCRGAGEWLEDGLSKASYLGALWYWLTYETRFIQTMDHQYFAVKTFFQPLDEIIVDAGAFVGDTVEEYLCRGLNSCKIYAFEPDHKLRRGLEKRVERLKEEWSLDEDRIVIVPAGVGKENGIIRFLEQGNKDSRFAAEDGGEGVQTRVYAIDKYFEDKEKPTLIKADIEGSEMDMLRGASEIIRRLKPKLALCIYHSLNDYVAILEYVRSLRPDYRFAVRNHSGSYVETVLYCY